MAIQHVRQVFVVNGQFNGNALTGSVAAYTGNPTIDPITNAAVPTLLALPSPGANDIGAGNLTAINAIYKTPYLNLAAAPTTAQVLQYQFQRGNNAQTIQFAVFDPVRGARFSDNISWDNIQRVQRTPYETPRPHVTAFFTGYNTAGVPPTTFVGQDLTIGLKVGKDYPEIHKYDLFASVRIPGAVSPALPPQPATINQIRAAHFQLLEQLILADPNGLWIDAAQSRLMSYNANYLVVYIVGAFKRIFAFDQYAKMTPVKHDLYFVNGFQNPVFEYPSTGAGLTAAMAANQSYAGVYVTKDNGNGTPAQVRWAEAEALGYEGHTNNVQWQIPRRLFANDLLQYDCVDIDYFEPIRVVGENQSKNSPKQLSIYFNRQAGAGGGGLTPAWNNQGAVGAAGAISGVPLVQPPAPLNKANFSLAGSGNGGANYANINGAAPAAWAIAPVAPPVLLGPANPGAALPGGIPANSNSLILNQYVPVANTAIGAAAALFCDAPTTPATATFIGNTFAVLNT
jgi:hypothetical protein